MASWWYVCKYVDDLLRDEPRNLGVIVQNESEVVSRFVGERPDGVIDGRRVPWVRSADTYRLWVRHWRSVATSSDGLSGQERRSADNYFLSPRMETLFGSDTKLTLDELADTLFARLVAGEGELAENLREHVERVFGKLELYVEPDPSVLVEVDGVADLLNFDYRYTNGRTTLMERLNLANVNERSWDRVHAASWNFSRVRQDQRHGDDERVALVRTGASDRQGQLRQLRVLETNCAIVDFATGREEEQLVDLLSL